jgi:hypothetical protein
MLLPIESIGPLEGVEHETVKTSQLATMLASITVLPSELSDATV